MHHLGSELIQNDELFEIIFLFFCSMLRGFCCRRESEFKLQKAFIDLESGFKV